MDEKGIQRALFSFFTTPKIKFTFTLRESLNSLNKDEVKELLDKLEEASKGDFEKFPKKYKPHQNPEFLTSLDLNPIEARATAKKMYQEVEAYFRAHYSHQH